MIIKDEDTIITHFGVQGMRWGVRKKEYKQNRVKAQNIINQNLKERDEIWGILVKNFFQKYISKKDILN